MGVEVAVALGAASLIGSVVKGVAEKTSLDAQAQANDENAVIANRAATDAAQRGDYAAVQRKIEVGQLAGKQQLALAASGLDTTSGTPAALKASTRAMGDLDALMAQNNAASEAYGYSTQASNMRKTARLQRQQSSLAIPLSLLSGVTLGASQLLPYLGNRKGEG